MTVGELIEQLTTYPHDLPVIIGKEPEGNEHSPLNEVIHCMYAPETTYSGDIYEANEAPDDAVAALVLYPVN